MHCAEAKPLISVEPALRARNRNERAFGLPYVHVPTSSRGSLPKRIAAAVWTFHPRSTTKIPTGSFEEHALPPPLLQSHAMSVRQTTSTAPDARGLQTSPRKNERRDNRR